jgi:hypothetical protein
MRPLRYSINVTLDGCYDHRVIPADEELHRNAAANLERADALLFGRVTYEMMEVAWRRQAAGAWPDWMADWMVPFAQTMDGAKKYVVSSTLDRVDWNAELVRGDLGNAVQQLKREPGEGLFVAGVKLALALTDLGLICLGWSRARAQAARSTPPGGSIPSPKSWSTAAASATRARWRPIPGRSVTGARRVWLGTTRTATTARARWVDKGTRR